MRFFTIVAGVNGVGKSSLTGALLSGSNDLGVVIDEEFSQNEASECAIEKGINFTQETTLSGVRTLRTIKQARERDYRIRLYYVGVNTAEESIRRIKNRVEKGGHGYTDRGRY